MVLRLLPNFQIVSSREQNPDGVVRLDYFVLVWTAKQPQDIDDTNRDASQCSFGITVVNRDDSWSRSQWNIVRFAEIVI